MNNVHVIRNKKNFNNINDNLKGQFIIQKHLGGFKNNIFAVGLLFNKNEEEKMSFVSKSILTKYRNGGPAVAGIEVKNKFILNTSRRLLQSLKGFNGPAMIEYIKLKGKNEFHLIDFNARIWGYSQLATFNAKNFPQGIVDAILGNKIKQRQNNNRKYFLLRDFIDLKILIK